MSCVIQLTESLDQVLLPMPERYPSRRLVGLDDADGQMPLRQTDQLLNLSYGDYTTQNSPWYHRTQRNVD